jgi:hypothetical protein
VHTKVTGDLGQRPVGLPREPDRPVAELPGYLELHGCSPSPPARLSRRL